MMKMKENQLAVQSLNSVLPAIKQLFLDCSYNEIKEAVIWYAANRNRYNKDAASANLAEELNYIDIKDTFYKENGHFRLQPENDAMEPIIVPSVQILGKVVSLLRKF